MDQLLPFKTKIQNVVDTVNTNKRNLERLKFEIQGAIAAAKAAAIVKAEQEAKDAAAAEKLRQDAVDAIDDRIRGLRRYNERLREDVQTLLTRKTESVLEISRKISDIMTDDIDRKMSAVFISQQTKDLVHTKFDNVTHDRDLKFSVFDELKATFKRESKQLQKRMDTAI